MTLAEEQLAMSVVNNSDFKTKESNTVTAIGVMQVGFSQRTPKEENTQRRQKIASKLLLVVYRARLVYAVHQ